MKDNAKLVLKIGLGLFIIMSVLFILSILGIESLRNMYNKFYVSIPITNVIILAYVWNRGEERIAKIGLGCLGLYILLNYINNFSPISTNFDGINSYTIYQAFSTLLNGIVSLAAVMALFSLIKESNPKINIFRNITIAIFAVLLVVEFILIFSGYYYNFQWCVTSTSIANKIAEITEYTFIILYLVSKKSNNQASLTTEVANQQSVAPQVEQAIQSQNNQ